MTARLRKTNSAGSSSSGRGRIRDNYRQPFWVPIYSFYILAVAVSVAVFFVVWGILYDPVGAPWIPAGILASFVLGGAVVLREVILRERRNQLLLAQEQLDYNLKDIYQHRRPLQDENKLTLEKNAELLKQISQKSEAANVLAKFSEAHWEVFELCEAYLHRSEKELQVIRAGSPRLLPIRQGREKVRDLHKFHLLAWSSAEAREFIQEANASATMSNKVEIATKALNVLDSAIGFYPKEPKLIESLNAVKEFIANAKVSHWIEEAERCAFKGNYKQSIDHYRDALFYLSREKIQDVERELLNEKINLEIEKLEKTLGEKGEIDSPPKNIKIIENEAEKPKNNKARIKGRLKR